MYRPSHVPSYYSPYSAEGGGGMGAAESKTTFRQAVARLDLSGGLLDQLTCENVTSVQVEIYVLLIFKFSRFVNIKYIQYIFYLFCMSLNVRFLLRYCQIIYVTLADKVLMK
jgi:hypothetical protein